MEIKLLSEEEIMDRLRNAPQGTGRDLAKSIGINHCYISQLKNGKRRAGLKTLRLMNDYFSKTFDKR